MKAIEHEFARTSESRISTLKSQALDGHENKFSKGIETSPNVEQESVQPMKADDHELAFGCTNR